MNRLNNFDEFIKGAAEDFEMPYDPSEWTRLQNRMHAGGSAGSGIFAVCASAVLIAGMLSYFSTTLESGPVSQTTEFVQQSSTSEESLKVRNDDSYELNTGFSEPDESIPVLVERVPDANESIGLESIGNRNLESLPGDLREDEIKVIVATEQKDDTNLTTEVILNENIKQESPDQFDFEPALPEVVSGSNEVCVGAELEFNALSWNKDVTFEWSFGDGKISSSANPIHKYDEPGRYTITLYTRSVSDPDVVKENPHHPVIVVLPKPVAEFEYRTDENKSRPVTRFEAKGSDKNEYFWDLGNGVKAKGKNTSTIYAATRTEHVELTAISPNGCKSSVRRPVYLSEEYNLLAPLAMTCNGDGRNETWFPMALTVLDFSFELDIYNRSGEMVYSTRGINPWNGINRFSGENCEEGHYVWHVKLTNDKGQKEEYRGTIYLSR